MTTSNIPQEADKRAKVRAIFFDFLGTLLDWHTPIHTKITEILNTKGQSTKDVPLLTADETSTLALRWRAAFFRAIAIRHAQNLPPEDIDTTHQATFVQLLEDYPAEVRACFTPSAIEAVVAQWHTLPAWPDVLLTLKRLKAEFSDVELFVLANGTTRLHLDLLRSSGLDQEGVISMAFSSQLLGCYKPQPAAYLKAMNLVGLDHGEGGMKHAVMVAAHAYDLRAARQLVHVDENGHSSENGTGMRTVYIRRWTEDHDMGEDFEQIRVANDAYIDEGNFSSLVDVVRRLNNDQQ